MHKNGVGQHNQGKLENFLESILADTKKMTVVVLEEGLVSGPGGT